ncbi:hypothetical protein FHS18_006177 [Paenibacillus phyllosphaerae]|uniref:Uncharacterized protein n=1 Tax=Paenibacillus phyllosphaerae TaxID=274593 RepID=A0A7W5B516_9BACL|nr:hypothetical protein [Paenibacillus phyllosphaerae]
MNNFCLVLNPPRLLADELHNKGSRTCHLCMFIYDFGNFASK